MLKPDDKMGAFTSSKTSSYQQVGELLSSTALTSMTSSERTFNKASLTTLVNMISGGSGDLDTQLSTLRTNATTLTATDLRAKTYNTKTSSQSIVVKLGNLDWIVTYVSPNESGDVVATLWLSNNHQEAWGWDGTTGADALTNPTNIGKYCAIINGGLYSDWSANWAEDNTSYTYPSAMYGTSYIRAETLNNGGGYVANATDASTGTLTTATQSASNPFALFTMDEYGLTASLEVPDNMSWMKEFYSTKSMFGWNYDCSNNSLYNNTSTGTWKDSGYNYASKGDSYIAWKDDYLWLPSITETGTGEIGDLHGLWELNNAERSTYDGSTYRSSSTLTIGTNNGSSNAYLYHWSRSASNWYAYGSYSLYCNGSSYNNWDIYVDSSRAVRPALLLNLTSVASHVECPKAIINLDKPNGSGGDVAVYLWELNTTLPTITPPTREGYTFGGYYTAENGGGTLVYNADGTPALSVSTSVENTTIYAKWTVNDYTLTLNNMWATTTGTTSVVATYDAELPTITIPTNTTPFLGYYTGSRGWGTKVYNADGTPAIEKSTFNADTTLYAFWATMLTLDNQGATTSGTTSVMSAYHAELPTITVPTKTGFPFCGYYTSINGSGTKVYNADGTPAITTSIFLDDTTLYADWAQNQSTLTLDSRDATSVGTTSVVATYNATLPTIATVPTKTGYAFYGYRTVEGSLIYNADGSPAIDKSTFKHDTTLYAVWSPVTLNDYIISDFDYTFTNTYYSRKYGWTAVAPEDSADLPKNAGVTGGYIKSTNEGVDSSESGFAITFTATCASKVTVSYMVSSEESWNDYLTIYVNNGYLGLQYPYGSNTTFTTVTWPFTSGSNTLGFSYSKNGSVNSNDDCVYISGIVIEKACVVTLNNQDATTTGTTSVDVFYGDEMPSITIPARDGYAFGGYYSEVNGGGTQYYTATGASAKIYDLTTDTTLYAYWLPLQTITLDNQSATTDGDSSVQVAYGFAMPNLTTLPTKTGYAFGGYFTGTNGAGTKIYNADGTPTITTATFNEDTTLYASWGYDITINANIEISTDKLSGAGVYADGDSAVLGVYAVNGFNFLYWLKDGLEFDGNDANPLKITVTGGATYTAVFEKAGISVEEFMVASTKGGVAYVVGQDVSELDDDDTVTIMTKTCMVGYQFVGWYLDNDRTTLISDNPSYRVAKSVAYKHVLVAVYREVTNSNVNQTVSN